MESMQGLLQLSGMSRVVTRGIWKGVVEAVDLGCVGICGSGGGRWGWDGMGMGMGMGS